jgi:hypothetical protein
MYTEADLRSAVAAGAISAEAADALRTHATGLSGSPAGDEEHFRLLSSFNDIFVTIAAVLLLVAMAGVGSAIVAGLAGVLTAGAAWGMAEFFTRKRRMALPSIVLLIAFVGGIAAAPIEVMAEGRYFEDNPRTSAFIIAAIMLVAAGGAYLHWRRFMVPITVAAGAATIAATVLALVAGALGPSMNTPENILLPLVFMLGLAIFGFAMRWDMSDRERQTRRSDVAFWLHLLAAPMICHPLFHWIGVTEGYSISAAAVIGVIVVYILMGVVALAVDRRALLVSALAYVLVALSWLFDTFGAVQLSVALTALVIGSALLMLSAFWSPIRAAVVEKLPGELKQRLPVSMAALPA